ncbi:hypothetical protein S83_012412, partial [Arachis hypogaea]
CQIRRYNLLSDYDELNCRRGLATLLNFETNASKQAYCVHLLRIKPLNIPIAPHGVRRLLQLDPHNPRSQRLQPRIPQLSPPQHVLRKHPKVRAVCHMEV